MSDSLFDKDIYCLTECIAKEGVGMSKEQYNKIVNNAKETLDKNILDKISEFNYKDVDGYYVIQVYVKETIKAKEMGTILTNLEDYAKECGSNILVDFLRG